MSEPLSSHEIEDVLSSIRRLVSEDLRPALRQTGPAAAEAAAPPAVPPRPVAAAAAGRLVLTQALRVVAAESTLPAAATVVADPPADPGSAAVPPDEVYDDAGLDDGAIGLHALLDATSKLPETALPPAGATGKADADDGFLSWDGAAGQGLPQAEDLVWAAPGDETEAEDDPEPLILPAAGAARRGHWTAETMPQVAWSQPEDDWTDQEPVPFAAHPRAAPGAPRPQAETAPPEDDVVEAQTMVPPGVEAAASAPRSRDEAGSTMRAEPGLFDGDETAVDEELLRDIVREIIREELAGTLGERITRNVRKLVRVEINRALTAREFE